jgi:hypothetical protein
MPERLESRVSPKDTSGIAAEAFCRRQARNRWMREQTHSKKLNDSVIRYCLGSINPPIKGVLPMSRPTLSFDCSQDI